MTLKTDLENDLVDGSLPDSSSVVSSHAPEMTSQHQTELLKESSHEPCPAPSRPLPPRPALPCPTLPSLTPLQNPPLLSPPLPSLPLHTPPQPAPPLPAPPRTALPRPAPPCPALPCPAPPRPAPPLTCPAPRWSSSAALRRTSRTRPSRTAAVRPRTDPTPRRLEQANTTLVRRRVLNLWGTPSLSHTILQQRHPTIPALLYLALPNLVFSIFSTVHHLPCPAQIPCPPLPNPAFSHPSLFCSALAYPVQPSPTCPPCSAMISTLSVSLSLSLTHIHTLQHTHNVSICALFCTALLQLPTDPSLPPIPPHDTLPPPHHTPAHPCPLHPAHPHSTPALPAPTPPLPH